jgi:streptogramin lyase
VAVVVLLTVVVLTVSFGAPRASASATTKPAPDSATAPGVARIVDYPTAANTYPAALTSGPKGRLWFTEDVSQAKIGSFDPATGHFAYYTLNQGIYAFKAQGIAVGPNDHLWMSANGTYAYQFDPATSTSENYEQPVGGAEQSVTYGPDGDMWFTGGNAFTSECALYSVNPTTAVFTRHNVTSGSCYLFGITNGPDGTLWFTDPTDNAIGEFEPSTDKATEYPIPRQGAEPDAITEGSDHALWFTERDADEIGRIDPTTHVITEYAIPTPHTYPRGITSGPDGKIWFTENYHAAIGSIDPTTGKVTEYSVAGADHNGSDTFLDGIAVGPDGNLWINDEDEQLLRFSLSPSVVTEPTTRTADAGSTVRFTSTARGIPAPTVQWQTSSNGGSTWSSIAGATSSTLSVDASGTNAGARYRAVFTNSVGSVASTPASLQVVGAGYWLAGRDGGVFAFGTAPFLGSLPSSGIHSAAPIVGMGAAPNGGGYWLVGADGGVFAFGDAGFFGSLPSRGITPTSAVVGMVPTTDGRGYWLVEVDGQVVAFGDARDVGEMSGGANSVGIAATGGGYWIANDRGGVAAVGAAKSFGSLPTATPPVEPSAPIVSIARTSTSDGYWLAGADGGVFAFGDAPFLGSLPSSSPPLRPSSSIVGLAASPGNKGYWLAGADGGVFAFGDAGFAGSLPALGVTLDPSDAVVALTVQT